MGDGFDVDVQDGNSNGSFVINDNGHFQVGGQCCDICSDCQFAFAGATVTVTVTPPGPLTEAAGSYTLHAVLLLGNFCEWWWRKTAPCDYWELYLMTNIVTGVWHGDVSGEDDCIDDAFSESPIAGPTPDCTVGPGEVIFEDDWTNGMGSTAHVTITRASE